jgi:hypothetical protein
MKRRDVFVRNRRSSVLLERFLITSVTTVLVIRLYLGLTGYPQIGGGGLHIAHVLWGGLGMLVALVLSLAFLGRRVQSTVALLGGIGFGTFIDELGKFLTSDTNYFFQPTIAIIYFIFIVLLLSFQILESPRSVSVQERLTNALNILKDEALYNLREQDKKEILLILRGNDSQDHHLNLLADAVERMPAVPAAPPSLLQRMAYKFSPAIIIIIVSYMLLLTMFGFANLVVGSVAPSVVKIGWLTSSFLSSIMMVIGIVFLRKSLVATYTWFKRAILVSIFLTQVFLLYTQPMNALVTLLMNLIILAVLNYLMRVNLGSGSPEDDGSSKEMNDTEAHKPSKPESLDENDHSQGSHYLNLFQ